MRAEAAAAKNTLKRATEVYDNKVKHFENNIGFLSRRVKELEEENDALARAVGNGGKTCQMCRIWQPRRNHRGRPRILLLGRTDRPMVFVCSPFAGCIRENIQNARRYSRFAYLSGYMPITPHLICTRAT